MVYIIKYSVTFLGKLLVPLMLPDEEAHQRTLPPFFSDGTVFETTDMPTLWMKGF